MFNRTTSTKLFAPSCQDRKEKYFPISPNLAPFAPLRESSFIRSFPYRAKPVLSPSFVRINSTEGTPIPQRIKSQFRISKPETNYDSNPKSQFRNPKQCQNSNYQNLKLFNSLVLEIRNYVIRICFVFRISCFEFTFLFNLGALCIFARGIVHPIP